MGLKGAMDSERDLILRIGIEMDSVKDKISRLKTELGSAMNNLQKDLVAKKLEFLPTQQKLRKQVSDLRTEINKLDFTTKGTKRSMWSQAQIDQREKLTNSLQKVRIEQGKVSAALSNEIGIINSKHQPAIDKLNKNLHSTITGHNTLNKELQTSKRNLEGLGNKMKKQTTPFAGWAMSIMFAGMALQRFSMSIYKFGTKAFQEISHSVEGTVTNTDRLEGSMKYLGFTVGQALEPLLGILIPIIDRIADWTEANPKLVATLTALGIALGTLFMVGGMMKLAINGFKDLYAIMSSDWAALGAKITKGIGIIAIGYALVEAKTAYDDFKDGKVVAGIISGLSAGLTGIGGIMLVRGNMAGGYLIAIGVALKLVKEGVFLTTLTRIFGLIFALIETVVQAIGHNFKQGIIKGVVGSLIDLLSILLASPLGSLLGFDVSKTVSSLKGRMGMEAFDFGSAYTTNYRAGVARAKEADKAINYYINEVHIDRADNMDELMTGINAGVGQ
jgi:hypothetical protein